MAVIKIQKVTNFTMLNKMLAILIIMLMYIMVAEAEVPREPYMEKSFPSDGISLVVVKNANGNVKVSSWERPEVLVKVFKSIETDDSQSYGESGIGIEKIEGRIEITNKITPEIQPRVPMNFDIFIPEHLELDIEAVSGSINVSGIRSKGKMTTINGNIELKNIVGSVSASSVQGNIYAEIFFDAPSKFATISGSVDIRIGDEFSVPISVGSISGSINVTIPEGFSANLDAATKSGNVSCDLSVDGSVEKRSLHGSIYGGGPTMGLKTISGNIAIRASESEMETTYEQAEVEGESEEEEQLEVQEVPFAETVRTLDPPVIDGKLDDECWKKAGLIDNFVWANGSDKPHEPTEVYLLWDDQNFYIGVKCYESRMDAIKIFNTENDNQSWDDDNVQFFIEPTPDTPMDYYHITVNPIGVVVDQQLNENNVKRNWTSESANSFRWNMDGLLETDMQRNFWTIEAAIPFSALKAEPEEGDVWRFNLHRIEQRKKEYTYWSPTYASDEWPHIPERFGELVFTVVQPVKITPPEQITPSEEALTISHITIEGNNKVSQDEILGALGLKPGDLLITEGQMLLEDKAKIRVMN